MKVSQLKIVKILLAVLVSCSLWACAGQKEKEVFLFTSHREPALE